VAVDDVLSRLRRAIRQTANSHSPKHDDAAKFRCLLRVELLEDRTAPSASSLDWIADDLGGWPGDGFGDDPLNNSEHRRVRLSNDSLSLSGAGDVAAQQAAMPPNAASTPASHNQNSLTTTNHQSSQSQSLQLQFSATQHEVRIVPQASNNPGSINMGTVYVPINANNDNWRNGDPALRWKKINVGGVMVDQPGIPLTRDYYAQNYGYDPQLIGITWLSGPSGLSAASVSYSGEGRVKLWMDNIKFSGVPMAEGSTFETPTDADCIVYIEGLHESSSVGDVTVTITVPPSGLPGDAGATYSWTVTVTPVINTFYVSTPVLQDGEQLINFMTRDEMGNLIGAGGLKAQVLKNGGGVENSATFYAEVVDDGAEAVFVQNVSVYNGPAANGSDAGWVYQPWALDGNFRRATNKNLLPDPNPDLTSSVTFSNPGLDAGAAPSIFYRTAQGTSDVFNHVRMLRDYDSRQTSAPGAGTPLWSANVDAQSVDVKLEYKLYLGVKFNDDSFYPVAHVPWSVNFFANGWQAGKGPMNIVYPNGVVPGDMQLSHDEPRTNRPTYNASVDWR
jgi:hypothetical protein